MTPAKGCRTGPPGYTGWQAGKTPLCRSQLYPPVRDYEFGYSIDGHTVRLMLPSYSTCGKISPAHCTARDNIWNLEFGIHCLPFIVYGSFLQWLPRCKQKIGFIYFSFLLSVGTFTSVFKDNNSFRSQQYCKNQGFPILFAS